MFGNDAPKRARIGRADGLAFEYNGRITVDQRTIADIAVPHDPPDIGRSPKDITGIDIIDVFHRPVQGDQVAGCLAYDTLRGPCGTGSIKNIGGMIAFDGNAVGRSDTNLRCMPVKIATFYQVALRLFALQDQAKVRLMLRLFDGAVQ